MVFGEMIGIKATGIIGFGEPQSFLNLPTKRQVAIVHVVENAELHLITAAMLLSSRRTASNVLGSGQMRHPHGTRRSVPAQHGEAPRRVTSQISVRFMGFVADARRAPSGS